MNSSELCTYLTLMGNQRLEHLEEEIFADNEATTIYLHNLASHLVFDDHVIDSDRTRLNSEYAYYYAAYVIVGRWEIAEPTINQCSTYAYLYYTYTIGDHGR